MGSRVHFRDDIRIFLGGRITETPKVRIPLADAEEIAEDVADALAPYAEYLMVVGSVRRRRSEVGDIELVVLPLNLNDFIFEAEALGYVGGKRILRKNVHGLLIELYLAHTPQELGALTLATTGDRLLNVAMRKRAKARGWTLNQYGLFDARTLRPILQSAYEGDYFDKLGMDYHEPEERSLLQRDQAPSELGCSSMDCYQDLDE